MARWNHPAASGIAIMVDLSWIARRTRIGSGIQLRRDLGEIHVAECIQPMIDRSYHDVASPAEPDAIEQLREPERNEKSPPWNHTITWHFSPSRKQASIH
jgi:hypothetical protein